MVGPREAVGLGSGPLRYLLERPVADGDCRNKVGGVLSLQILE